MTKLTPDEAKRIVLEKYPEAKLHGWWNDNGRFWAVMVWTKLEPMVRMRLTEKQTSKEEAWLSAAHHIQEEKDK